MKYRLLTILCLLLFIRNLVAQQGCPNVNINVSAQDTTFACCGTLTASYVQNAQTTAYTVGQIPYQPFSFTGGTAVIVNTDDIWSGVVNLPFTFCFYGNTYNQCVIGANGLISFNTAYANQYCPWPINNPIPSNNNPINSIMAPFHDIDPSVGGNINYQLYGTYPCRILVVNWNQIPMFQCNNSIARQQIVIYETTNVIETYIANKPTCNGWNGGDAIHGIQNATGTLATVVPGRNFPTNWTAANDAYRFTPSGGASNVTLNWYQQGSPTVIATGTSVQVCPSVSTNYIVQAIYDPCVGINISKYDTVFVNVVGNTTITSTSQVNIPCNGGNTGAASFTYQTTSANPVAIWWNPPVSTTTSAANLTAGTYTVYLADTSSLAQPCTTTHVFNIIEPTALTVVTTFVTNVSCNGQSNGNINITPSGGTLPYTFTWNTNPVQNTEDASNLLAGTYNINITDANNCSTSLNNIIVTEPPMLVVDSIAATLATCANSNANVGAIVLGGTSPYNYTWNGNVVPNNDSLFNVGGGNYNLNVADALGCLVNASVTVNAPLPPTISASSFVNPLCSGGIGAAAIAVSNGTNPISYSWSPNVSTTDSANNILAGNYFVTVTDFYNCTDTQSFVITQPTALMAVTTSVTNVSCNGQSNGSINITPSGGILPYVFTWNTNPAQNTEDAANLPAGTYNINITDANNCSTAINNIIVTEPALLVIDTIWATVATCGNSNAIASAVVLGGTNPYNYTWNNNPVPNNDSLVNIGGGNYSLNVADSLGCFANAFVNVAAPLPPVISASSFVNPLCFGGTGSAAIAVSNGTAPIIYSWSPNVSATDSANNILAGNYLVTITDFYNCTDTQSFVLTQPTALTAVLTNVVDVNCNGESNGSIDITVAGGTLPYTYTWNTNPVQITEDASNLPAGIYEVTVTDGHNCSATITNILVAEPTALVINSLLATPATCGNTNGTTAVVAAGGNPIYTYTWNNNVLANNDSLFFLNGGTYTIQISDTHGCTVDSSVTVAAPIPPTIVLDSLINPICFGALGSINLSINNGTNPILYSWFPNVSATNIANNLPAGTYFVSVTDFYNCLDSQTFTLVQQTPITANLLATTNVNCYGELNGSIDIDVSGGVLPYTYTWNTNPVQYTQDLANIGAGNYNVIVSDSSNCSTNINNILITQPTQLVINSLTATPATCGNNNGTTSVVIGGGTPIYTYTWNGNLALNTTNLANLAGGAYVIHVEDTHGCFVDSTITVAAPIPPTIASSAFTNPLCFGGTGSASITVNNGTAPLNYVWNPNVSATNVANGIVAGNYFVTVTDFYNCTDTQSFVLTQPSLLAINVSNTNNLCFGDAKAMATSTGQGGVLPYIYSWSNGFVGNDSALNLPAGNYTAYISDANNCLVSQNFAVTQPPQLTGTATGDTICIGFADGTAAVVIGGGVQPYNYLWTNGVSDTAMASNLPAGIYLIQITDANGCKITQNTQVVASTLPIIMSTNVQNIRCFGETNGQIAVNIQQGVAPFNYNWSPAISGTNVANNLAAGNYQLIVSDHFSCKDSMSFTLTEPALLQGTVSAQNVICHNAKNGKGDVVMQGGTLPYTYTWNTQPPRFTHNVNLDTGTYTITVRDANLCTFSQTITITQPDAIVIDSIETNPSYCTLPNGSMSLSVSGGVPPLIYSWSNGVLQSTDLQNIVGNDSYTFYVTDQNMCSKKKTIPLKDVPPPIAAFTTYPTNEEAIFVNTPIHFSNQSQYAMSYLWLFGDGDFEVMTSPNHTYLFPDSITAMLIAYNDSELCPDTATMNFMIIPEGVLWFPNVFTPNGDNHNDVYQVNGLNVISFNMTIFDRWGKVITELTSMQDSWNGTKEGKPCPEGVYTFTAWGLTINNVAYKRAGTITLIR